MEAFAQILTDFLLVDCIHLLLALPNTRAGRAALLGAAAAGAYPSRAAGGCPRG